MAESVNPPVSPRAPDGAMAAPGVPGAMPSGGPHTQAAHPSEFQAPPPGEFAAPALRGRHVYLKPITPSDYPFLQMVETAGDLAPRWRHRGATPSPEQWVQTLWAGVLCQFMVVGIKTNKPVGRVLVYQPNFQDRYAYFAAMRFEPADRSPLMVLGSTLFLQYVFGYWDFDKLYMEVPEYNLDRVASGLGRMFEVEGRFRHHLRMGGRSWDQLVLALYRDKARQYRSRLMLERGRRSTTEESPNG